jgi:hypothetical protein
MEITRAQEAFFVIVFQPNLGVLSALDFELTLAFALEVAKEEVGAGSVRERASGPGMGEEVAPTGGIRTREADGPED